MAVAEAGHRGKDRGRKGKGAHGVEEGKGNSHRKKRLQRCSAVQ